MRRRVEALPPMSTLTALFIVGYRHGLHHLGGRILRELGRLPDADDVHEAEQRITRATRGQR